MHEPIDDREHEQREHEGEDDPQRRQPELLSAWTPRPTPAQRIRANPRPQSAKHAPHGSSRGVPQARERPPVALASPSRTSLVFCDLDAKCMT
jgi:hypothetical protein